MNVTDASKVMAMALLLGATSAWAQGAKALKKCPPDAVISGTVCMDKYEASVWRITDPLGAGSGLVKKVKAGKVTAAELTAAGATRLGVSSDNYALCTDNGQDCTNDIYAVSLVGETPSRYTTWFQAQQACKNAGKRLPWNDEWQAAVAGTPNPGPDNGTTDCNTAPAPSPGSTGSRSSCVSADGAFDMVGNLHEWVADWVPRSTACGTWSAGISPTNDYQCLAGAATTGEPGALVRGGAFYDIAGGPLGYDEGAAGPLFVSGLHTPSDSAIDIGFRCAR